MFLELESKGLILHITILLILLILHIKREKY